MSLEKSLDFSWASVYEELRTISQLQHCADQLSNTRRRVLFLLENIEKIPVDLKPIVQDLLCSFGFFPYLNKVVSDDLRSAINLEFHRSDSLPEIVLHREQFFISELLL